MKKVAFLLVTVALSLANAKTYHVSLYNRSVLAGTELKAGDYSLDWNGGSVVLKSGKLSVTAPVRVEKADRIHEATTVRLSNREGKLHFQEIRLQGTDVRLVLTEEPAIPGGLQ